MCYLLPNHSNAHLHKLFLSHSNKISVIPAPPLITSMAAWCREEIAAWRVGLRKVRITVAKPALWTFSCLCHLLCPMATTSVPTLSTHVEPGGEATGCLVQWCQSGGHCGGGTCLVVQVCGLVLFCAPQLCHRCWDPHCSSVPLAQISFTGKTGYERRGWGAERASGSS